MRILTRSAGAGLLLLVPGLVVAQDSTTVAAPKDPPPFTVSAFIDTYYAHDFGEPRGIDRLYTTQAVRNSEANVNLAFIALQVQREHVRGKLALQFGTAVQAAYASEYRMGTISGPEVSRYLQEAYVGLRLAPNLWLDGGIFCSYIGLEGWVSRDNPTYTRSLVFEFTPAFQTGARVTWQPTPTLVVTGAVVNGWQMISEDNGAKSFGARLDYTPVPAWTLSYANFFGNEQPGGQPTRLRVFNQVMARGTVAPGIQVQGQFDYGREGAGGDLGARSWYGAVLIGRAQVTPRLGVSARVERYSDPEQVLVLTGGPTGFRGNGGSVGLDVNLPEGVLWRTELRGLHTSAPLFSREGTPDASRSNALLVTSLALTM